MGEDSPSGICRDASAAHAEEWRPAMGEGPGMQGATSPSAAAGAQPKVKKAHIAHIAPFTPGTQQLMSAPAGTSAESKSLGESMDVQGTMDYPAMLYEPSHPNALHTVASSDEDTSRVPDFADPGQQAPGGDGMDDVPEELRSVARAVEILQRQALAAMQQTQQAACGSEPEQKLEPTRFDGVPEPMDAAQLRAAATILAAAAARNLKLEPLVPFEGSDGAVSPLGSGSGTSSAIGTATAGDSTSSEATTSDEDSSMGLSGRRAVRAVNEAPLIGGPSTKVRAPRTPAASAAASLAGVSVDLESHSVQLRRQPDPTHVLEGGQQLAASLEHEAKDAEARLVVAPGTPHGGREAREAVWGEGGWPYGAQESADIVDGLKDTIRTQQEAADQPAGSSPLLP